MSNDSNSLSIQDFKIFLMSWNNRFRYDRKFRKKYSIAFNSPQHRALNPIDIFLDLYEDELVIQYSNKKVDQDKEREEYLRTGEFLKERVESEAEIGEYLKNIRYE